MCVMDISEVNVSTSLWRCLEKIRRWADGGLDVSYVVNVNN